MSPERLSADRLLLAGSRHEFRHVSRRLFDNVPAAHVYSSREEA